MSRTRALPPALIMGLTNPYGLYGALTLMTVPQVLAERSVPRSVIAAITAAAMIPTFCGFLLSPILDVRFSRRNYALSFGVLTAVLAFVALVNANDLRFLTIALIAGFLSANLNYAALGGWLSGIINKGDEAKLGAGFTIGNIGGFGLGAIMFITLLRALPGWAGAAAVSLILLMPLILVARIPAGSRERRTAQESFKTLRMDLFNLVKRQDIRRLLLLFCLPASSFALTNSLGGVGGEFGASERFVAVVAAIGVTGAGVAGSLFVPGIIGRVEPRYLYLLIGTTGAFFTLSLLGLPRTPLIFAVALIGQNIFQSAAFATESTIIFRSIGEGNPVASTQFAFLQAATALPITYMQMVDGQGYRAGGLAGSFLVDAGFSLLACSILLPLVIYWQKDESKTKPSLEPA
jgi:PAT family beta-lactamase induction signal transducer AmpG